MKIVITHSKTKRQIDGPFNICGDGKDLVELAEAIFRACGTIENPRPFYGWIEIQERLPSEDGLTYEVIREQKEIPDTPAAGWDYNGGEGV